MTGGQGEQPTGGGDARLSRDGVGDLDGGGFHDLGESPSKVDVRGSQVGNGVLLSKGGELGSLNLDSTNVTGDVQLADNRGTVSISNNAVGGSVQANKNTGGLAVTGNNIVNGLQCQDNTPAPTGGGNVAAGVKRTVR